MRAPALAILFAVAVPALGAEPADHAALDALLRAVVRDDGVDYALLRGDRLAELDAYLDRLAEVDPARLGKDAQIALYLNLYNATVLRAVAVRYRPGYRVDADSFALFGEPLVRIGGETMSLDRLEKDVLRKRFADPRIHAALVCASRSCPKLSRRAYAASDLDTVLEERMRLFLRDPARNRVDSAGRTLFLSRIFEWYADDFGGKERLLAYAGRYLDRSLEGFRIEFLDYSWELNDVEDRAVTSSSPDPSAR